MKNFVIKDLEHLSGIKAHTLRAWEQRYDIIRPHRNHSNFRRYSIEELQRLLNIAQLTRNGFRISHIATMSPEEINHKLVALSTVEDQYQRAINNLVVYMYTLNSEKFEVTIDLCLQQWDTERVLKNVILEFLRITGLKWQGRKQTEEHMAITTIRKKILSAINLLKPIQSREKSVLLFLPDSKQLDLILLCSHFLLLSNGFKVLYMGMDVTVSNLQMIFKIKQPDAAITYLHNKYIHTYNEFSTWLTEQMIHTRLFIVPFPNDLEHSTENISVMPLEKIMNALID